jgi:hypothetical protein
MLGSVPKLMHITITTQWGDAPVRSDQRRHRRLDAASLSARAAAILTQSQQLALRPCPLSNLSYGGMCCSTEEPLVVGAEYRFLIDLASPFDDLVLVKARTVWTGVDDTGRHQAGVQFVESSKGWFGPEDEPVA